MDEIDYDELAKFMDGHHKQTVAHAVEMALRMKFPGIEDLQIVFPDEGTVGNVSYKEGKYTKEDVETYITELRKNINRFNK